MAYYAAWPELRSPNAIRKDMGLPEFKFGSDTKPSDVVLTAVEKAREIVHQKPGYQRHLDGPTDFFDFDLDWNKSVMTIVDPPPTGPQRLWAWMKKGFQNE